MKTLVLFFLLPVSCLLAQDSLQTKRAAVVKEFVTGYNNQNLSSFFALFPEPRTDLTTERKKQIEAQINDGEAKRFQELGKAHIDTMTFDGRNRVTVKLSFEKDRDEISTINFFFSADTLMGFGQKPTEFNYTRLSSSAPLGTKALSAKGAKIDSLFTHKFVPDGFNGCAIVLSDGKPVYKHCFGYANYDTKVPLNDSSVFELASVSKQFTAMGIMILAEQRKLKYSDPVKKFIPELPYEGITVENLLTHTSGLPDYIRQMDASWDKSKFATNYDIIKEFRKDTPAVLFAPNEKFTYSNTGYAMLSVIIEKASGMSYGAFLKKYIFAPLKMTHSRVYNTRRSTGETIPNYAFGYIDVNDSGLYMLPDSVADLDIVRYLDGITGDGSVNSTILDLAKWDEGLYSNKLVSSATLKQAYSKHILSSGKESFYGYGEFLPTDSTAEPLVYHSGGWPGYHTFILRMLDHRKTVIVLSNNSFPGISEMADKITKVLVK